MVSGLVLCATGIGGLSLALYPGLGVPYLLMCRLCTGFGVSAFTAGAFMYLADISTKLNRARTMAPAMASFQSGTALGPAIGGFLIENVGIEYTYAVVGLLFASLSVVNHFLLPETLVKNLNLTKCNQDTVKGIQFTFNFDLFINFNFS